MACSLSCHHQCTQGLRTGSEVSRLWGRGPGCCGGPRCPGPPYSCSPPTSTLGKVGNPTVPQGPSLLPGPARKPWTDGSVGWNIIQYTKSFHSWSGHIHRLQVRSPVKVCTTGSLLMSVCLSVSGRLSVSLSTIKGHNLR